MDIIERVKAMISATVGFYFVDEAATSPTKDDYLRTHPAQPPARMGRIHARRMWPFGLRSIIPAGVEAVTVSPMGSQTQKVIVGAESNAFGPTDLAEGDTVLYSSAHKEGAVCVIKAAASGKITINSKGNAIIVLDENGKITIDSVAGQDVVVNGGTLKVARVTDLTTCGVLQFNTAGVGVLTGVYTDPDGAPAPFTLGAPINLVGRIAPGGGATRFKG